MSVPTLKQRTKTLFASYNNSSDITPDEFIDYVFSLPTGGPFLPISAGVANALTGDLVIDTVIKDSTGGHIRSADFNNRFLADTSGVARYNWDTGVILDAAAKKSIDSNLHQLFDTAATPKKSVDYNLRQLFLNDGATAILDYTTKFDIQGALNIVGTEVATVLGAGQTLLYNSANKSTILASGTGGAKAGFFGNDGAVLQDVSNAPMVLLADVITIVDEIRTALAAYNLINLV